MADFTTWDRSTLEQFAREATARLIKNSDAINELLLMLHICKEWHKGDKWRNGNETERQAWESHQNNLNLAITKHESTTKEQ